MFLYDADLDPYLPDDHAPGNYLRMCHNPRCARGLEYFSTTEPRVEYCSDECQKSAQNARAYARRRAKKAK